MSGEPSTPIEPPPAEAGEEQSPALSTTVTGLSCPSCGGALEVDSGQRVITCSYCETPLLALSEVGIRRFAVRPQVSATKAREIAGRWLASGMSKDSRLRQQARLGEAFLCFLPFYRVEADTIGFALGTEKRRRTVGSGKRRRVETYEVDVERSVAKSFDSTYPALRVAEWGVRRVQIQGDLLVPFEPRAFERLGMIFPPTGSEIRVQEAALEQFKLSSDPAAGLHRVRFRHLETLRERLSVIYYPLWVVRYRFLDRSYQVLVDGEDGSISYGKAPGGDLYRAVMLVTTQAVAIFVGTTLLQWFHGGIGSLAFIGIPVIAALLWGWKKFRHGGVVVEGSGAEGEPGLTESIRELASETSRQEFLGELAKGRIGGLGR